MNRRVARQAVQILAVFIGLSALLYASYETLAWYRFGHVRPQPGADVIVDRFMPAYEVREVHKVFVKAPAATTMEAARSISLDESPLIRAIFKGRQVLLRSKAVEAAQPRVFIRMAQSIGWRVLAQVPGREMVFGAVTQPWKANVVFHGVPPAKFAAFDEPGYVKIVWTMRADPIDESTSVFSTETRAVSTDASASAKFRRYWASYSAGIVLIRLAVLPMVKANAEHRVSQ